MYIEGGCFYVRRTIRKRNNFYAVCGICALNIIMKLIEALYCTYICRQSAYMYEATGKFAVRINRKFDNEYDENGDIRNVGLL